jgi:hypothetical protein
MKRPLAVTLLILLLITATVHANSTPVRWVNPPSSVMFSVAEDTPLSITEEQLVFDFSTGSFDDFSRGSVHATYEMLNTEAKPMISPMVFPLIGSIGALASGSFTLEVDGDPMEMDVLYGPIIELKEDGFVDLGADTILAAFEYEEYEPVHYRKDELIHWYELEVDSTLEEFDLIIQLDVHPEQHIFTLGFNGFEMDDQGSVTLSSWQQQKRQPLKFYVSGDPVTFTYRGEKVVDGKRQATTDFKILAKSGSMEMEPFLLDYIQMSGNHRMSTEEYIQNRAFYLSEWDQLLERQAFFMEGDVSQIFNVNRLILFVYQVPFEENQAHNVRITYPVKGSMDRSQTVTPLFTYRYLLSPAKHWKSFQNLTITVIPPEEAPYLIDSNLAFSHQSDGSYIAIEEQLPGENLHFTLYEHDKVTASDRVKGFFHRQRYALMFIGLPLLGVFMLLVVGILVKRERKMKE